MYMRFAQNERAAFTGIVAALSYLLWRRRSNRSRYADNITIRRANDEDAEAVALVWSVAYHDDPGTVGLSASFLAERVFAVFRQRVVERIASPLVAVDVAVDAAGQQVGFCVVRDNKVEQFFLARIARGTGAAQKLMARAEQRLAEQGTSTAHLFVFGRNQRARGFYKRCGWTYHHDCAHDVQLSGGRTYTLPGLMRYEKELGSR